MKPFAKIFTHPSTQILIVREKNEEGDPAVALTVDAPIGQIRVGLGFDSKAKADEAFDSLDEAKAREWADAILADFASTSEED